MHQKGCEVHTNFQIFEFLDGILKIAADDKVIYLSNL